MNHKTLILITSTVLTSLTSVSSHAGKENYFTDYARVLHVEPRYKTVTVRKPERRCEIVRPSRHQNNRHNQRRSEHNNHSNHARSNTNSAVFVGGIIGGAIGHHVTKSVNGRSNNGATLAGAVIGSTLAHNAARQTEGKRKKHLSRIDEHRDHRRNRHEHNNRRDHQRRVERCRTITVDHKERRLNGYKVTYEYHGHRFHTRTKHDPGHQIAIRVQIKPH